MTEAKKIELFLPNGDPTGCLMCDVANWDGKIFRLPKNLMTNYLDRPELQYTGIYFLIGGQDELKKLYIGEAENLSHRLVQHINKDFWSECLVITKKENAMNKAHAKFLENYFYQLTKRIGRCIIVNGNTPTKSSISEADEAILNDFSQKVADTIGVIGYRFLTPLIDVTKNTAEQFEITSKRLRPHVEAKGMITNEGFVVMKGSTSMSQFKPASSDSLRIKWEKLRSEGIIKNNTFVRDYLASSPSTAAAMVLGRNANGLTEWKTKNGKPLKKYLGTK